MRVAEAFAELEAHEKIVWYTGLATADNMTGDLKNFPAPNAMETDGMKKPGPWIWRATKQECPGH